MKLANKKRLLILGPSFRRRRDPELLPAIERYDGIFFRVARKYMDRIRNIDTVVMTDDLKLIEGNTPLPYREPLGHEWGKQSLSSRLLEEAESTNEEFLKKKLKGGKYYEVFLAMGKTYAKALPDLEKYGVKVIFPTKGGPGPKAQALKQWIQADKAHEVY